MSVSSIVQQGRRLAATTFLDTCIISDRSLVRDTTGGYKQTWTPRMTQEPCRFAAIADDVAKMIAGSEFGDATALLLMPLGIDIAEGDKVENVTVSGIWIVTRDITPPSNISVMIRVGIKEV